MKAFPIRGLLYFLWLSLTRRAYFRDLCTKLPRLAKAVLRKRPLIVFERYAGIGDILCTFPSLEGIQSEQPNAFIIYQTLFEFIPLVENSKCVAFGINPESPISIICRRFLYVRRIVPILPDEKDPPQTRGKIHLIEEFCRAVSVPTPASIEIALAPTNKSLSRTTRLIELYGLKSSRLILIHVGPTWEVKQWPKSRWDELVSIFSEEPDIRVIQIGSDRRAIDGSTPAKRINGAIDWVNKLGIADLIALFGVAKLFVGIDSGMLHMATACGTRSVGVFGPTDPKYILRENENVIGLKSDLDCIGCHHHFSGPQHWRSGCRNSIKCMISMSAETVFTHCRRLLIEPAPKSTTDLL